MRLMKGLVNARGGISAGLLLILVIACSGTATPTAAPTPASGEATVSVTLNSFSVTPSLASAPAGTVTFDVSNASDTDAHELVVIQTDLAADQLPLTDDDVVDENSVRDIDELDELDPGASGTLTVDLPAGHYVLICNVEGHYSQGMYVDFTAEP